jgi:hypothetical protein
MKAKSKLKIDNSRLVRISNSSLKLCEVNKKKTGVPIGIFIEQAIALKILIDKSDNAGIAIK